MESTTSEYIVVKKSSIHSNGVFAKKDIPKKTKIIEYVGDKVTKKESDIRYDQTLEKSKKDPSHGGFYIFELNKTFDIDGDVPWNTARYINHSCNPNCETDIIDGHIYIISIKNIKEGEEITYDYGCGLEDYENHHCKCCSKNCIGYIISKDEWPKLRKKLAKKKARKSNAKDYK